MLVTHIQTYCGALDPNVSQPGAFDISQQYRRFIVSQTGVRLVEISESESSAVLCERLLNFILKLDSSSGADYAPRPRQKRMKENDPPNGAGQNMSMGKTDIMAYLDMIGKTTPQDIKNTILNEKLSPQRRLFIPNGWYGNAITKIIIKLRSKMHPDRVGAEYTKAFSEIAALEKHGDVAKLSQKV